MKIVHLFKARIATAVCATMLMVPAHAKSVEFNYRNNGQVGTHQTMFFTLDSALTNVFLAGHADSVSHPFATDYTIWKDDLIVANYHFTGYALDTSSGVLLNSPLSAGNYALTVSDHLPAGTRLSEWVDHPQECDPDWPHCDFHFSWHANVSGETFAIPAVPEPGTSAMLLAGLGLTGLALRRKRNA